MKKELNGIIKKSYQVFKKYKATIPLDVCTECCLTKNQESELVSLAVQHIPFDLLYKYNTAAMAENPNIQEFKHFLPRFLEFTGDLLFLHHTEELVLSRFDHYDKREWTAEEQLLMQEFGQAYFHQCLTVYPLPELAKIDSILIMLWKTKIDIGPLLTDWLTMMYMESILHFNDLIVSGFKENKPDELMSSFADKELEGILVHWLEEATTKDKFADGIERIIMDAPIRLEERALSELSWTYEKIKVKKPI